MIRTISSIGTVAAGVFLLALAGCADGAQPVAPTADTPSFSAGAGPDLARLARFGAPPQVSIGWAKKRIGPEGGRLDFQGFAIEVPPGAVDRATMFTIRLPVEPRGSERVVAEFLPHGARFAVPVAIELPFAGTSIESSEEATIVWWNGGWVDMGGAPTADGARLRTVTDHFSTYGTTDERGGSLAVSGG